MRRLYSHHRFSAPSRAIVRQAEEICASYAAAGYDLTLRQLYYQFVARGLIPNKDSEYKRLGSIINDARMAGLLDWNYIVDRTRNLRANPHWSSPAEILRSAAKGYAVDMWGNQKYRPEVWIEKDALVGVIENVCRQWDVPFFSCRGYTSQSEMWSAGRRVGSYLREGKTPIVLHFGDHDPSGIDMSRDIRDRLWRFLLVDWVIDVVHPRISGSDDYDELMRHYGKTSNIVEDVVMEAGVEEVLDFRRLALNRDQIDQYDPPPNPAKLTDARATAYIAEHGRESWELDALEPQVISQLIEDEIRTLVDMEQWERDEQQVEDDRRRLLSFASNWT